MRVFVAEIEVPEHWSSIDVLDAMNMGIRRYDRQVKKPNQHNAIASTEYPMRILGTYRKEPYV